MVDHPKSWHAIAPAGGRRASAKLGVNCLWLVPEPAVLYVGEIRHLILTAVRSEEFHAIFDALELTQDKFINFSLLRASFAGVRDSSTMSVYIRVEGETLSLVLKTLGEAVIFEVIAHTVKVEDLIVNGVQMHFDMIRLEQAFRANPDAVLQRLK